MSCEVSARLASGLTKLSGAVDGIRNDFGPARLRDRRALLVCAGTRRRLAHYQPQLSTSGGGCIEFVPRLKPCSKMHPRYALAEGLKSS